MTCVFCHQPIGPELAAKPVVPDVELGVCDDCLRKRFPAHYERIVAALTDPDPVEQQAS